MAKLPKIFVRIKLEVTYVNFSAVCLGTSPWVAKDLLNSGQFFFSAVFKRVTLWALTYLIKKKKKQITSKDGHYFYAPFADLGM